jgi:hypothetical protein
MVSKFIKAALVMAALGFAGVAHAGATSGSIWLNQTSNSAATIPGTAPDATFDPGPINYNPSDNGAVYTFGAFLNNPVFMNQSAQFIAAGGSGGSFFFGTGNTFIDITGTVGLQHGDNDFVVAHDDGVVLNITGFGTVVNEPGPTAESFTHFTVTNPGAAGNFAFNLQYAECCSPPAALVWQINNVTVTGSVPEPATWAMMLLGIAGVGAAMRYSRSREFAATAA